MRPLGRLLFLCTLLVASVPAGDPALESAFLKPPDSAWPWVYWIWPNGNLTREGITADLEAMHRVGIRGALILEVELEVPAGPVRFLSPQWRDLFRHTIAEATRLGIVIATNNDGGWSGSGGPWITPELSMQVVSWSETPVRGSRRFDGVLARPKAVRDYYRDIAVLAIPAKPGSMTAAAPKITCGADHLPFDASKLLDGNPATVAALPALPKGAPHTINLEFARPFEARSLTVALDAWYTRIDATVEASTDGVTFRPLAKFLAGWPSTSVSFDAATARHFRLSFDPGRPMPVLGELDLNANRRLEGLAFKALFIHHRQLPASSGAGTPVETITSRQGVLDLTSHLKPDGRFTWAAPPGDWVLLRVGYTTTGKSNHPAPPESVGLECDKLSKHAVEVHFAGLMEKLIEDQRAVGGNALRYAHIDSWEAGSQNWTPAFREEFQRRRGYDPLPFLVSLTGRAVESEAITERFLWDWRRTISDLIQENYAGHMAKLCHDRGLQLSIEGYGGGPLDDVPFGGRADMPISEFWTGKELYESWVGEEPHPVNKEMVSAAHAYGRPVIAAEAFTAVPRNAKWMNFPFRMKALGDTMFALGVNRFIFHRYAAQPWTNRLPGMTMGQYGVHFERTNTWWEMSTAYLTYLARCQYLLQQGRFVADVAYLSGEKAPNLYPGREALTPSMPDGYDYDIVPPEVLLTGARVEHGQLVLQSGMKYRVLVLPTGETMRPALLEKLKQLVADGATVIGPPPRRSPSLSGYPNADTEVIRLAGELWSALDGASLTERRYGKGRVIWGKPIGDVLRDFNPMPDFTVIGPRTAQTVNYIHREIDGADVYFVASPQAGETTYLCSFRASGRRPELWWPDTGRIERTAVYDTVPGATRIPIGLGPYGSVFVVFPKSSASSDQVVAATRDNLEITGMQATSPVDLRDSQSEIRIERGQRDGFSLEVARGGVYELRTAAGRRLRTEVPPLPAPVEIAGPWTVDFPKDWGAPPRVTLDRLVSWTAHPDPGVKYFSGTASYRRQVQIPETQQGRKLYLDLGRVEVMAEVMLNGQNLGIVWKPPYRVDITPAARPGANDLEIRVVNLWPNRLIGDAHLPEDAEWNGPSLIRWPQWLLDGKPSPTGRLTFATWKHWNKDDPLLESGLLGPVVLETWQQVTVVAPVLPAAR
ncbi:MAG: hypothetical protein HZB13_05870 [Acidobacteria bacterium]|nr:hypothetical protein [Acidobacteriota bacterium]